MESIVCARRRDPPARRDREGAGLGHHHRLGRLGRSRGADRADRLGARLDDRAAARASRRARSAPWSAAAPPPASPPRSTRRSPGRCSRSRSCSATSACRSSARSSSRRWWRRSCRGTSSATSPPSTCRATARRPLRAAPLHARRASSPGWWRWRSSASLYGCEELLRRLRIPEYLKAALGGLIVGGIGIWLPAGLRRRLRHDQRRAGGQPPGGTARRSCWSPRSLATSITLASGGSGGVFAPSLFLGAMTGGFLGTFIHQPGSPPTPARSGAYALVTMGAVVGAATHAPITAIIIIFELTGDYRIIAPLMAACVISTLVATLLRARFDLHPQAAPARHRPLQGRGPERPQAPLRARHHRPRAGGDCRPRRRFIERSRSGGAEPALGVLRASTPTARLLGSRLALRAAAPDLRAGSPASTSWWRAIWSSRALTLVREDDDLDVVHAAVQPLRRRRSSPWSTPPNPTQADRHRALARTSSTPATRRSCGAISREA